MAKFYKTTYTVTVLSTDPINPDSDIEDVLREMTDGEFIGDVELASSKEIEASSIRDELLKIGNDGCFFDTALGSEDDDTPSENENNE